MTTATVPLPQRRVTFPWEFNGVVRLTRAGTAFIIGTVVLAVAAVNTGNNALYIGVTFMLGSLLLSGMASKGGLKKVEIEITGIDEAWAGQPSHARLTIRNRSRIWSVRDVVLVSEALASPVYIPVVARRGEVIVDSAFLFMRRGLARVSAIDAYTRYPFGFVLKKRRLRVASEVLVLPRLLESGALDERFTSVAGEQSIANRAGHGTELHSFRDYTRGDSLRHVHWKKSASLGRWIMKQTAVDAARSVHVVVDPYKPSAVSEDDFEAMVTAVASFVHHAGRRGVDVTLALPRVTLRARAMESTLPMLRALAMLEPLREPLAQLLDRDAVVFSMATPGGFVAATPGPAELRGAR